jgi:putative hydrolase of the HAD superfamily
MIEAVLLDLGNVLVFHDDRMLLERLAALGGRSPDEVERALAPLWDPVHRGRIAGDDLRRAVSAASGAPLDDAAFRAVWSCHFRIHHEVLPEVQALLGRVRVLLLSNTNAAHVEHVRPLLPMLERFDALVLSYQLGVAKPDPAIFAEALRRAGTPPERTAYFDDVEGYVAAARALGIQGHLFTDAARFRAQLAALGL